MAFLTRSSQSLYTAAVQLQVKDDLEVPRLRDRQWYLPVPRWGAEATTMPFKTAEALEAALAILQGTVEEKLKANCYNTIGSFLTFYRDFKNSSNPSFYEFYRNYEPSVISKSLSCVGLSFNIIKSLQNSKLEHIWAKHLFVASCEEWTDKSDVDCQNSPATSDLKEHVLAALKFDLDGRFGVVLLDLGYHINFPVVVMADESYPHTGSFIYSETCKSKKEYSYTLAPGNKYVIWTIRETRNGKTSVCHSYIYIHQQFHSAVQVVEKKCMVYNFRTIVARDKCGPKAGFYCNFNGEERFSLFYKDSLSQKNECKISYTYFECSAKDNEYEVAIENCAVQCGFSANELKQVFKDVIRAFRDDSFTPFMKCVNDILEGEIESGIH